MFRATLLLARSVRHNVVASVQVSRMWTGFSVAYRGILFCICSLSQILNGCVTGHNTMANEKASQVLKDAGIPTYSRHLLELFTFEALQDWSYNSKLFFEERSARTELLRVPFSVFSEFPNSYTSQRFQAGAALVQESTRFLRVPNPEESRIYLQHLADAFLIEHTIFSYCPVNLSKIENACNIVANEYPSACEDSLIARVILSRMTLSPESVQEATAHATEAIRIMKLSNAKNGKRRLKLARLQCLTGCLLCLCGRYDNALDNFNQSLDLDVDNATLALSGQALCYYELGLSRKAYGVFLEYLAKAPRCDESFAKNCYVLASLTGKNNNWQEACYYYEQGIEAEMNDYLFCRRLWYRPSETSSVCILQQIHPECRIATIASEYNSRTWCQSVRLVVKLQFLVEYVERMA